MVEQTRVSKITKKLDGVLDFGIGSKPFEPMGLDDDNAYTLCSDNMPVTCQLESLDTVDSRVGVYIL